MNEEPKQSVAPEGFYAVAQQNNLWWFIEPSGAKLLSLGINHIEPVLIIADGNRDAFVAKYGADLVAPNGYVNERGRAARAWMKDSMNLIRSWGFNTIGVHNPIPQAEMPYVAIFRPAVIDGWAKIKREYPDPYDPQTETKLQADAQKWCNAHKNDPWILGISLNDMPIFRTTQDKIHEWVAAIMSQSEFTPGKREWLKVLKERYPSPVEAAAAYGVEATTWEELAARTTWPQPANKGGVLEDVLSFLPQVVDRWYALVTKALRACDPNHLIFGDKFEGAADMPPWLDQIIGKYFDVIYIQWYEYAEKQIPRLRRLHAATGKPILMGDSSFSCPNEHLPVCKGVHVKSQNQVGDAYSHYLETISAEPYILGWHHCGFIEGSPDLKRWHPYFAIQCGFLRPDGTPYEDTVAKVTKANTSATGWHERAKPFEKPSSGSISKTLASLPEQAPSEQAAAKDEAVDSAPEAHDQGPSDPGKDKPKSEKPKVGKLLSSEQDTAGPERLKFRTAAVNWQSLPKDYFNSVRCRTEKRPEFIYSVIDDNIYNLAAIKVGMSPVPNKNIGWVVTDEGVVVIDTGFPSTAMVAKRVIRQVTQKPISYIIYTHHHGTQIAGAAVLKEPGTTVIAHEDLVLEFDLARDLYRYYALRDGIQFNLNIKPQMPHFVYPDVTFKSEYSFTLGGVKFDLYHANGESRDYTLVHLPGQNVVWVADMLGSAVPLVASPMKPLRDDMKWKQTLEFVQKLDPEILLQSVEPPFCHKEIIKVKIDSYLDFLDFLHSSVARELNNGSTIEETLANIVMPPLLKHNPFLTQGYGCLRFNVQGVYEYYSGWFSREGADIFPTPSKERAASFIQAMGGPETVFALAKTLKQENRNQLALDYLNLLITSGSLESEARQLKALTLEKLAAPHEYNRLIQNMYRRLAQLEREKSGVADRAGYAQDHELMSIE